MLTRIEILDFALIERAVIGPGQGLLILTGETGAGKSILVDAIGALCGGKVGRDMIRHGQDKACVEAVFSTPERYLPEELASQLGLNEESAPDEGEDLILSREILSSGKSVCRVNGRLVSLSLMREISTWLIDIHGQHDQQAIFQTDTHLQLLDRYGSPIVSKAFQEYQAAYQIYQDILQELSEYGQDPSERARLADMLQYQTREIEAARIKPNEDEQLVQRQRIVANAEKIRQALADAYELLDGDSPQSVLASLGQVVSRLDQAARQMPELDETRSQVAESMYALQNTIGDIRASIESTESDPGELEKLNERLDQINRLKKKYGGSLPGIQQFYLQARQKLDQLNSGEARHSVLQQKKQQQQQALINLGGTLTELRKQAAANIEQHITLELADLGMKDIKFSVQILPADTASGQFMRTGLDRIEFLISPNPGEPLRPLVRIASGGEASRIMLAIKSILARADRIPVLIFDEIDTGVSGRTAGRVAEKLQQLSRGRQVFCITHLAQIAAMADTHILIEKNTAGGKTRTSLHVLDNVARESELARLLSGGVGDAAARSLASELMEQARSFRQADAPFCTVPSATGENPQAKVL